MEREFFVGVRTHHISLLKKIATIRDVESYFAGLPLCYKVGFRYEREDFIGALRILWEAVHEGHFYDKGETPDNICGKCLNAYCDDLSSYALQDRTGIEKYERWRIHDLVTWELISVPAYPSSIRHECECRRIDELFKF